VVQASVPTKARVFVYIRDMPRSVPFTYVAEELSDALSERLAPIFAGAQLTATQFSLFSNHLEECVPALRSFFGTTRPAPTGIGVASLATPDTLVEIEAVARIPARS